MNRFFAKTLSVVFHPCFLFPLGLVFILFFFQGYFAQWPLSLKLRLLAANILFTVVLPILLISILKFSGVVQSIYLQNQEERPLPFLLIAICFGLNAWQMTRIGLPFLFTQYAIGASVMVALVAAFTLFWKISAHGAGAGGFTGLMFISYLYSSNEIRWYLILALLISGLVFNARIRLEAHTYAQFLGGYFLGFISLTLTFIVGFLL